MFFIISYHRFKVKLPLPSDVHGIPLRVASLEDTLKGKIEAWSDPDEENANGSKILQILPGSWKHILISGICSPTISINKSSIQRRCRPKN